MDLSTLMRFIRVYNYEYLPISKTLIIRESIPVKDFVRLRYLISKSNNKNVKVIVKSNNKIKC